MWCEHVTMVFLNFNANAAYGLAFRLWIIEIGNLGNWNEGCSDDKKIQSHKIKGNVEVRKSLPYLI